MYLLVKIVQSPHPISVGKQVIREMRAYESGATSDEYMLSHFVSCLLRTSSLRTEDDFGTVQWLPDIAAS
jgi:hypothetical protein